MAPLYRSIPAVSRLGLLALLLWQPLRAAEPALQRDVQAVFLLNLTRFIRWPEAAFASADAPLTIGVLPREPVGMILVEVTRGEKAGKHPIVVRELRTDADLDGCQLVFLAQTDSAQAVRLLSLLKSKPVVTVSDAEGFLRLGGQVQFYNRHGQVKLRLDLSNLTRSDLVASAQLLRVADLVEN